MKFLKIFIVFFLINLSLDVYFVNTGDLYIFRVVTKPLITISLAIFFFINSSKMLLTQRVTILLALTFLCIGDVFLLENLPVDSFIGGLSCFFVGLLLYCYFFYKQTTYDIDRLLPFLAVSLLISLSIIYLMYDKLNSLLIPVVVYMVIVLNLTKIAYLRYKNVSNYSYYLVMIGSAFFTITQILIGLNRFHEPLPYKDFFVMSFYGISQLLIILGILIMEYPRKEDEASV